MVECTCNILYYDWGSLTCYWSVSCVFACWMHFSFSVISTAYRCQSFNGVFGHSINININIKIVGPVSNSFLWSMDLVFPRQWRNIFEVDLHILFGVRMWVSSQIAYIITECFRRSERACSPSFVSVQNHINKDTMFGSKIISGYERHT